MKSKKNIVVIGNTASFQLFIKEWLQYFPIKQIRIEFKQSKACPSKYHPHDPKSKLQTSNKQTKHAYTISCHRKTSNILVNVPDINSFINIQL